MQDEFKYKYSAKTNGINNKKNNQHVSSGNS